MNNGRLSLAMNTRTSPIDSLVTPSARARRMVVWILLGFVWVALNPNKHHAKKVVDERQPSVIDVRTSLKVTFADVTSQLAKDASPRRR